MKRICTIFAIVSVLALTLFLFGSGTASAQTISGTRSSVSASQVSPLCAGYTRESQWTWNDGHGNVTITKWKNNCNGEYHCEAQDVNFNDGNGFESEIRETLSNGSTTDVGYGIDPFTPGEIINSPDLSGGVSYTCEPFEF